MQTELIEIDRTDGLLAKIRNAKFPVNLKTKNLNYSGINKIEIVDIKKYKLKLKLTYA